MRATKKEEQLIMDIYRRVYSEIGVDLDELIKQGVTKREGWFDNYYMPQTKQDEIIEEMLKGKRLTKLKKNTIRVSLYLGSLPSSVNKNMNLHPVFDGEENAKIQSSLFSKM